MEDDCNYCGCCCLKKVHNEEGKRQAWQCAAECGCCGKCCCDGVDPDDIGICSLAIRLVCCYAPVRIVKFLKNCVPDCLWFTKQGCKLGRTAMSNDHFSDYKLSALNTFSSDALNRDLSVESMTDLYSPDESNESSTNGSTDSAGSAGSTGSTCWRRFSLWRKLCNEKHLQQYADAVALGVSPDNAYQTLVLPSSADNNSDNNSDSVYVSIGSPIR